jgi:flagellar biosynthesis protein FliQ
MISATHPPVILCYVSGLFVSMCYDMMVCNRLASYGITVDEYKQSIAEFNSPIRAPTVIRVVCWVSALCIIAGIGSCIGGAVTSVQSATTGMYYTQS